MAIEPTEIAVVYILEPVRAVSPVNFIFPLASNECG